MLSPCLSVPSLGVGLDSTPPPPPPLCQNLQQIQPGPAQVCSFPPRTPAPPTLAESPEKHSQLHLEANDIRGTSTGSQQENHWVSASVMTQES